MNHLAMADVPTRSGELPAYRLRRVAQYIRENAGRELRLAELSAVVHMSPYHFARLFKRSTGVSPHRFLVQHRIDQARTLLAARKASIAEIAQAVGFRTPSHFTTTFRRLTGMAPSEYRSSGAQMAPQDRSSPRLVEYEAGPYAGFADHGLKGFASIVPADADVSAVAGARGRRRCSRGGEFGWDAATSQVYHGPSAG
jgi:AraC-like DNA-binding protein